MIKVTHPYGTTRRASAIEVRPRVHLLCDDQGEGHVLAYGAEDPAAKMGEAGTLTFTKGGPTGGYWKFVKD